LEIVAVDAGGALGMTSLAVLLKQAIEHWAEELRTTSPLVQMARAGNVTPRALALYLESLRYLFQHSQRNLQLAAEQAEQMGLPHVHLYFERKANEEHGHDGWAVDDLTHLPQTSVANLRPALSIVRLVELQRSLIAEHPICFVAYALWAEYFTVLVGDEWLDALSSCGYQRSQVSSIAKHVEADREHAANGFNELEQLWQGQPEPAVLLDAVARACRVFESFCDEICLEARSAA
jgi:hypothetical protein